MQVKYNQDLPVSSPWAANGVELEMKEDLCLHGAEQMGAEPGQEEVD